MFKRNTLVTCSIISGNINLPLTLYKPCGSLYAIGYAYTYNITLNNKDIEVSEPTINPWKGGDSNDASSML